MPLFTPTIVFERITCITPEFLGARGLRALILDVDNTLTAHGSQELPPDVAAWLDTISYEVLCSPSRRVPRVYIHA